MFYAEAFDDVTTFEYLKSENIIISRIKLSKLNEKKIFFFLF